MTVAGWTGLGCYVLTFIVGFRHWFRKWTNDFGVDEWDAVLLGIMVGIFFGATTGPFVAVWRVFQAITVNASPAPLARALAGESREQKAKRLEQERKDREAYIGTLERELGIG